MNLDVIVDEVAAHWPGYVAIPLVAAVLGYVIARITVELLYRPLTFTGLGRRFGWQGVVPRHAGRFAAGVAGLLTSGRAGPSELVARIDPDRLTAEVEQPLLRTIDDIARDVLEEHQPRLWEAMPAMAQELFVKRLQAGGPRLVRGLVTGIADDADELLDTEGLVVRRLTGDPETLVRLARQTARPERSVTARAGLLTGLLLGLAGAAALAGTGQPLVLVAAAALVGLAAAVLTVRLTSGALDTTVATRGAELLATEVLTVGNLVDALLHGPRSDRLLVLVRHTIGDALSGSASSLPSGRHRVAAIRQAAAKGATERLPDTLRHAEPYLTEALDIAGVVQARLLEAAETYRALLRDTLSLDAGRLAAAGTLLGVVLGTPLALLL